jgi:hypothetical protein
MDFNSGKVGMAAMKYQIFAVNYSNKRIPVNTVFHLNDGEATSKHRSENYAAPHSTHICAKSEE